MAGRGNAEKRRLTNSPLVLVLCEVKFAPVLTIEKFVPAIQERLRRNGFPSFAEAVLQQVQFGSDSQLTLTPMRRWTFTSQENDAWLTLTPSSLSLQVTTYTDFEEFVGLLRQGIDVVAEIVDPSYADRVGLRYVDAIPNAGEDLSEYFSDKVLTFKPADLGVRRLLSSQQILAETDTGQLVIRMNQVRNGALLPPDLQAPELAELSTPREGIHAILDIDSSDPSRSQFSWAALAERLWATHAPADAGFWKSVTDSATHKWGLVNPETDE